MCSVTTWVLVMWRLSFGSLEPSGHYAHMWVMRCNEAKMQCCLYMINIKATGATVAAALVTVTDDRWLHRTARCRWTVCSERMVQQFLQGHKLKYEPRDQLCFFLNVEYISVVLLLTSLNRMSHLIFWCIFLCFFLWFCLVSKDL